MAVNADCRMKGRLLYCVEGMKLHVSSLSKKSTFPAVFSVNVMRKILDNKENTDRIFFSLKQAERGSV